MLRLNPNVTNLEEEGAFAVLDRAMALQAKGHPVINLGIGQPDFPPPEHVLEAAEKAARDGPHGYTSPVGMPVLREAVAAHVAHRYGTNVDPDEVIIVPGGKVTFYFACMLLGGPGAEILYPDPGFPPYREAIRSSGAKGIAYPVREDRDFNFDPDEVLSLITAETRLIILNSPANPTGGVVSGDTLRELADGLCRHPGVAILSDEIYSHLVFEGAGFTSLMQFPELRERTILLDGWSKTFAMTGWRLGYGVWPPGLVEHVRKLITVDHSCVNGVAQVAALAALTGPTEAVESMCRTFAHRRQRVVRGLNALPGVSCRMPNGAFYAFPNVVRTGMSSKELANRVLEEAYVAVIAGDSFGANGAGFLRLSYAAGQPDLDEALNRLHAFLGSL